MFRVGWCYFLGEILLVVLFGYGVYILIMKLMRFMSIVVKYVDLRRDF